MKKNNQKGFTLIELLVVISIIGLLSTMAVISLNSARAKARDAKRVSDIKSISTLIEQDRADSGDETPISGCTAQYASTTLCFGGEFGTQTANFVDPLGNVTPCEGTAGTPSADVCAYSISLGSGAADVLYGDYQICTYLENGSGEFGAGLMSVRTGGVMFDDCN